VIGTQPGVRRIGRGRKTREKLRMSMSSENTSNIWEVYRRFRGIA
jgi:hypothetical protein